MVVILYSRKHTHIPPAHSCFECFSLSTACVKLCVKCTLLLCLLLCCAIIIHICQDDDCAMTRRNNNICLNISSAADETNLYIVVSWLQKSCWTAAHSENENTCGRGMCDDACGDLGHMTWMSFVFFVYSSLAAHKSPTATIRCRL